MSIRNLARTQQNNEHGITFYMLPYMPAIATVYHSAIAKQAEGREWTVYENIFLLVVTATVDIELTKDCGDAAIQISAFMDMKTGNPIQDFNLWLSMMSSDAITIWHDAYQKTRQQLPPASKALQEGRPLDTDPLESNGQENGTRRSRVKSSP